MDHKTLVISAIGVGAMIYLSKEAKASTGFISGARGFRNNNPGNIEHNAANKWQGMAPTQTDPRFVQFVSAYYGIRAMARILINYERAGANTISKIIERWAPSKENGISTKNYIAYVSQYMGGWPISRPITAENFPLLIAGMISFENNRQMPYSMTEIDKAIKGAQNG